MAGMGLGALWGGRLSDRRDPLRLYGLFEVALGLVAMGLPFLLDAAADASLPLLRAAGPGPLGGALRFAVAAAVVVVPSALLGATVPVLVRFAQSSGARGGIGASAGVIYALNTLGAALGCGLTGYVLLGTFGIRKTGTIAATIDIVVGLIALGLARRHRRAGRVGRASEPAPGLRGAGPTLPRPVVLALAAGSGFCVLGLETLWTRLLRIVMGHDVHAFASMLLAVLAGLAVGSAVYRALPARLRSSAALVPLLFTLLGASAIASIALVGRAYLARGLDVLGVSTALSMSRSHEVALLLQVAFAAACVIAPAVTAGAIFPALCAAAPARTRGATVGAGRRVGAVLFANTAGSIAGAVLVPLGLVPLVGIARAIVLVGTAAVGAGCLALGALPSSTPARRFALAAAVAALALATLATPLDLPVRMLARKIGPRHLELVSYEEGATGTVAVVRNELNDERQLFVNGVNEVTTRLVHDQSFKLLGHLGLLLHPDPKRILVVCLGAGISAGAASVHDVRALDIVDIERSVISGARHFADLNNGVLRDPRVRLIVDDGRNHLRTTARSYDAIVVDSTHPRAVDSWILYTTEFYRTARRRLTSQGHLVQWLPLHGLSVDEFRIVVRTFLQEFPAGSLWVNAGFERYGTAAYAILLGPKGAGGVDRDVLARRLALPRVARDLAPWGLSTLAEVVECFVAGPEALRRWTRGLPTNTDDLPHTQFITRYSRAAPMSGELLLEVKEPSSSALRPPPAPALAADLARRDAAQQFILAGRLQRAAQICGPTCAKPPLYRQVVAQGPSYFLALRGRYDDDPERLLEIAAGQSELGETRAAAGTLERAVRAEPRDAHLWLNLGLARRRAGQDRRAVAAFRKAVAVSPDLALARINLGLALIDLGDDAQGVRQLRSAVERDPGLAEAHAALGYGLMEGSDSWASARAHLARALALDPGNIAARVSLGRLHLQVGDNEQAVAAFREATRRAPLDADALFNLGVALSRPNRPDLAAGALREALFVDPGDQEARLALEQLRGEAAPRR